MRYALELFNSGQRPGGTPLTNGKGVAPAVRASRRLNAPSIEHRQRPINLQIHRTQTSVPSRAGPFPINRAFDKSTPHWVGMNVVDHRLQCPSLIDVSVIASPRLPETTADCFPLDDRDSGNPIGCVPLKPSDRCSGDTFLDLSLKLSNFHSDFSGRHQQMHMLRHDDPGPEVDRPFLASFLQLINEPESRSITSQEWESFVA